MGPSSPSISSSSILWRQVWAVVIMLAAILLGFMIYGFYQPLVLKSMGFGRLASQLGLMQGLLGMVIEPLMGGWSDYLLRCTGSRLPHITAGTTLAGLLFVAIALLAPTQFLETGRWVLLVLMVLWLVAMIAIRGPIVALLSQFAPIEKLPVANGAVLLVLGLISALGPVFPSVLTFLGAARGFMIGALLLVLGAIVLHRTIPRHTVPSHLARSPKSSPSKPSSSPPFLKWVTLALAGLIVGISSTSLLTLAPPVLLHPFPQLSPPVITSLILAIAAVSASPMGWLTSRQEPAHALQLGLGGLVLLLGWVALYPQEIGALGILVGLGLTLGLVGVSSVPFALATVAPSDAGLGTGLLFGGSNAGAIAWMGISSYLNPGTLLPLIGAGITLIGIGLIYNLLRFCAPPH